MDEILHQFETIVETMDETIVCESNPSVGFLNGVANGFRPSTVSLAPEIDVVAINAMGILIGNTLVGMSSIHSMICVW